MRNRILATGLAWVLMSGAAHAEMHKSGTSMGSVLWSIILLAVGAPLGIGLLAQVVVAHATDRCPSRLATLLTAFTSWWLGISLSMSGSSGTTILLILGTLILTAGMAYLSGTPATPDENEQ